jgi:RTX toxin acyltransferase family
VRAPVAVVTWASVSDEVAARLAAYTGQWMRLKPGEWTSGPNLWLIDIVGEPRALMGALKAVAEGPLKNREVSLIMRLPDGSGGVQKLHTLVARGVGAAA